MANILHHHHWNHDDQPGALGIHHHWSDWHTHYPDQAVRPPEHQDDGDDGDGNETDFDCDDDDDDQAVRPPEHHLDTLIRLNGDGDDDDDSNTDCGVYRQLVSLKK